MDYLSWVPQDLFTADKQWKRVYLMHQRARTHSYVNLLWLLFSLASFLYFLKIKYFVEYGVKCYVFTEQQSGGKVVVQDLTLV